MSNEVKTKGLRKGLNLFTREFVQEHIKRLKKAVVAADRTNTVVAANTTNAVAAARTTNAVVVAKATQAVVVA